MHEVGFFDRLPDGHPGIERRVWILEHHLEAFSESSQGSSAQARQVVSVEMNGARRGIHKSHDHPPQSRFTGSRFPDQSHDRAFGQGKGNIVDGDLLFGGTKDRSPRPGKNLCQMTDFKDRFVW